MFSPHSTIKYAWVLIAVGVHGNPCQLPEYNCSLARAMDNRKLRAIRDCDLRISNPGIPWSRLFSPIPNSGIVGVPIPGFRDYKNWL